MNSSLILLVLAFPGCADEHTAAPDGVAFRLTSPEIAQDSLLPREYTCDGERATLPLEWTGSPNGTQFFALIMHHEASPTDIHWYWVLYNIPASVHALPKNVTGLGTLGNNSVNGHVEYAPPCSQGPGPKNYVYTLYALSDSVRLMKPPAEVSREVLLEAIRDITLSSATLTVIYSRSLQQHSASVYKVQRSLSTRKANPV